MNKLIISAALLLAAMPDGHTASRQSLDSADGVKWGLCPQESVAATGGDEISTVGFAMPDDAVEGVVPGVVFTAYVNAGKEETPEYGDNIWRVDERFYNRPFWYRAEFATPADYSEGKQVWIKFNNTNRYADFYFNGVKLSGRLYPPPTRYP